MRLGRTPTARDWLKETDQHPSAYKVAQVFRSFPEAVRRASLPPAPRGRPKRAT